MGYRQSKVISRDLIEKSMDSINPKVLGLGTHLVEVSGIKDNNEVLTISFKGLTTKAVCSYDSFLYNSLLAAASYNDRDLLWSLKDEREHHLLLDLQVKVKIDISWGHTIIKQGDKYVVVNTKDNSVVNTFNSYTEAKDNRDQLGRAWLNVVKCYPTKRQVITNNTEHVKNLLGELYGN